jgi:hypothetical protein
MLNLFVTTPTHGKGMNNVAFDIDQRLNSPHQPTKFSWVNHTLKHALLDANTETTEPSSYLRPLIVVRNVVRDHNG